MIRGWMRLAALSLALAAGGARAACKVETLATFPVRMQGDRALIPVKLNGIDARMIVDSGAFFSSLSPSEGRALHLMLRPTPDFQVIGVGGVAEMQAATLRDLSVGDAALGASDILVGGPEWGAGIAGLLGHNVLRIADVEYDFGAGAVRLMQPRGCDAKADLGYWVSPGTAAVLDVRRPSRRGDPPVAKGAALLKAAGGGLGRPARRRGGVARRGRDPAPDARRPRSVHRPRGAPHPDVRAGPGAGRPRQGGGDRAQGRRPAPQAVRRRHGAGDFGDGAAQAELWLATHPADSRFGQALDLECEAYGLADRDLDRGMAACDHALRLDGLNASALEDRALVRLRRGEASQARADVDAALKLSPGGPEALYLRGVLKFRSGDKAGGEADIARSSAAYPAWAAMAKAAGLAPSR